MTVVGEGFGDLDVDGVTETVAFPVLKASEVTMVAVMDWDLVMTNVDIDELVITLVALVALMGPLPKVPPNGAFGLMLFSMFSAALLNASSVLEPWLMTPTMPPWQWASTEQ